ncbi:hypothetical protein DDE82_006325 [Stemphylium lycopersici]|nr:hypothetical protein TW65_00288 [Stemphylium lycopersici]RAR01711.1 hypothetical protein DDE82_006325 [Stemphylium lycopersici]
MRAYVLCALLLPGSVRCRLFPESEYLRDAETTVPATASPASMPTSGSPEVTWTAEREHVELRQAPAEAPAAVAPVQAPPVVITTLPVVASAPAIPVSVPAVSGTPAPVAAPAPIINLPADPVPPPPPAPLLIPIAPAPAPAVAAPAPPANIAGATGARATPVVAPFSNVPFVTVQWAETFIGGTYSTWWPHTISLDFKQTVISLPGKGQIGMGTLTGKTGQTRTVVVGAAPTNGVGGWVKGVAVAAGVGVMGLV